MAATGGNAFALSNPLNHLETTTNTDVTSALLGAVLQRAFTREATRRILQAACDSVSCTKDEIQQRSISLMTTTSAAGQLLCTIAILKDRKISSFRCVQVRGEGVVKNLSYLHQFIVLFQLRCSFTCAHSLFSPPTL